ncbi:MAG: DUF615 domain-containing protein [Desulfobacteraceae bacterium]|nr:MAG: DUF615 domain-containing protein [Desulfobacteraceae bacterium]
MPREWILKYQRMKDLVPSADKPSRTQKKRAAVASQKLGEHLVVLREAQLEELHLPPELHQAVIEARNVSSHGARRRQLQYIGSLMRHIDAEKLKQELDRITLQAHRDVRSFRQAETWRDELVSGDQGRATWLFERFPEMDKDRLMQLIEEVRKSSSLTDRRKSGRALFRFLRPFANPSAGGKKEDD